MDLSADVCWLRQGCNMLLVVRTLGQSSPCRCCCQTMVVVVWTFGRVVVGDSGLSSTCARRTGRGSCRGLLCYAAVVVCYGWAFVYGELCLLFFDDGWLGLGWCCVAVVCAVGGGGGGRGWVVEVRGLLAVETVDLEAEYVEERSVRRHQALFWRRCRGGKVKGTHILWLLSYLVAGECSKVFPLDSAILSFCFLFLFSLVRLNGKQQKIRELYSIFPELGMKCLKRKLKNLWNLTCMLVAMLLV